MPFELPKLPYTFDALEPHIDSLTMYLHYTKHHAAYVNNLNKAIEGKDFANLSLEKLLELHSDVPAIRNNGGGHWNHSFFWRIMAPNAGGQPTGDVAAAITKYFGSFEKFKELFSQAALSRFGSGWAWLCVAKGELKICSTANQDNFLMPNMDCNGVPILALDVWEHSYYLKHTYRRADYIECFFNVINWAEVDKQLKSVK